MREAFLIVKLFLMFGFNYWSMDEFIEYICKKTGKEWLKEHLKKKFGHIYEKYGAYAAVGYFFCEIDEDLQEALVDYAINVYAPEGMATRYKELKDLQKSQSEKYEKALERARDVHTYYSDDVQQVHKIEHIFPELKQES